ncbi:uncharacterized protein BJ171DRAFT_504701 [Polychytrium aggregatum]|uniref:uncharacterized protein n=1 Tax=Polychytrium aggregatum TaxID=110093 RepID=UPI0022FE08EA|nr:uncharacterized protein BJ171DRAFT_504701 [Polychytrium aggregatum]KAI9204568.1 hypothetical protein BJ171DRAFT_504701 [Polychytrium aggregatum]
MATSSTTTIVDIPDLVLLELTEHLDLVQTVRLSGTCRLFRRSLAHTIHQSITQSALFLHLLGSVDLLALPASPSDEPLSDVVSWFHLHRSLLKQLYAHLHARGMHSTPTSLPFGHESWTRSRFSILDHVTPRLHLWQHQIFAAVGAPYERYIRDIALYKRTTPQPALVHEQSHGQVSEPSPNPDSLPFQPALFPIPVPEDEYHSSAVDDLETQIRESWDLFDDVDRVQTVGPQPGLALSQSEANLDASLRLAWTTLARELQGHPYSPGIPTQFSIRPCQASNCLGRVGNYRFSPLAQMFLPPGGVVSIKTPFIAGLRYFMSTWILALLYPHIKSKNGLLYHNPQRFFQVIKATMDSLDLDGFIQAVDDELGLMSIVDRELVELVNELAASQPELLAKTTSGLTPRTLPTTQAVLQKLQHELAVASGLDPETAGELVQVSPELLKNWSETTFGDLRNCHQAGLESCFAIYSMAILSFMGNLEGARPKPEHDIEWMEDALIERGERAVISFVRLSESDSIVVPSFIASDHSDGDGTLEGDIYDPNANLAFIGRRGAIVVTCRVQVPSLVRR